MRPATALLRLAAAVALVAAAGCQGPSPGSADVAARIAGRDVPYERFEAYLLEQVGEAAGGLDSAALSGLFDQFLREELLTRLAIDEGRVGPEARRREAVDALLADNDAAVTPAALEAWYREHRARLALPERVRLRHILVPTRAEAERAQRRLAAGEDFATVAGEMSVDPSAEAGGDQGELALDDLPAAFAALVAELQAGEVAEPIQASDGWHLFEVVERLPGREQSLEEVAPLVEAQLRRQLADGLLERRLADAADRYNVEVYAQNLPFEYRGEHRSGSGGDRP